MKADLAPFGDDGAFGNADGSVGGHEACAKLDYAMSGQGDGVSAGQSASGVQERSWVCFHWWWCWFAGGMAGQSSRAGGGHLVRGREKFQSC